MENPNIEADVAAKRLRMLTASFRLILIVLALSSIAAVTYILAAAGPQVNGSVKVTPQSFYNGESIEINLEGFPSDFTVPAGALTLNGVRIPVPGTFGEPGDRPRTNIEGDVTFTSWVPLDVPYGPGVFEVEHFAGDGKRTTTVTVLQAVIAFSTGSTAPNRKDLLRGTGFSPITKPGGNGPLGLHQITGKGISGITVNGVLLDAPYVTYPINIDSDGGLAAPMILPESYISFPNGTLEIRVVDDLGRSGVGVWKISDRKITLNPAESGRGGEVKVAGAGFMAAARGITSCLDVDIFYAGFKQTRVRSDAQGTFEATIFVPNNTALSSSNTVSATILGCASAPPATETHKVPARAMTVWPYGGPVGSFLRVSGTSFVGYTGIVDIKIGAISVLPSPQPKVPGGGSFSFDVVIPNLTLGQYVLTLTHLGVDYQTNISVLSVSPTPTPSPTPTLVPTFTHIPTPTAVPTLYPTPTPTVGPAATATPTPIPVVTLADNISPLGGNLLMIWSSEGTSGQWEFYDPRRAFAGSNTLPKLADGQLYWVKTRGIQTVNLNGRTRNLLPGWNLIHW